MKISEYLLQRSTDWIRRRKNNPIASHMKLSVEKAD